MILPKEDSQDSLVASPDSLVASPDSPASPAACLDNPMVFQADCLDSPEAFLVVCQAAFLAID